MFGHVLQRLADGVGHLLGGFHHVAGHVDHTHHHVFALQQRHQMRRHVRVVALQAHLADAAFGKCWKDGLVLPPLLAQGFLPVQVGLDAVAVADVHSSGAGEPFCGAFQRLHAPSCGIFQVNVEGRFVKLDDVHAIGLQRQRLLVKQVGKGHGHVDLAAIKAVGHGVDNRHRAGQGELDFFAGVGTQQLRL